MVLTESRKKVAKCLFCSWTGFWGQGYTHVFGECEEFAEERGAVLESSDPEWLALRSPPQAWWAVLQAAPEQCHFTMAVSFAAAVEARAVDRKKALVGAATRRGKAKQRPV